MTIVRNDSADAFVRNPPETARLFLVHGNEEGLVHERARRLAQGYADAEGVVRLEGAAVASDPGGLLDEAFAIGLFGGKRALWIDAGGRDLAGALEPLFEKPPQDCIVVVEAGSLKKGTALRDAFEGAKQAASIECYADERAAILGLIDEEMRRAGVTIAEDAREALVAHLGADRMTSRGEAAKLALYALGSGRVEVADVEAIVADAAPSSLDAVIDAALGRDRAALEEASARFFAEGGTAEDILRVLVQRALLVERLSNEMAQGRSFDAAAQANFVRLPARPRAALERQVRAWPSAAMARRLPLLLAAAARVRRDPRLAGPVAMRLLWSLTSGGR